MRKRVFYPKLALNNLLRNRKTYAPYLLACIVSIFTLYTLMSINLNGALNDLNNATVVKSFTAIGTVVVTIFCGALIFYTNSFLIKRRKKELGLYCILGMEKRNIAWLMFFETLFITAAALFVGILLGMLLGQLLFWALLRMVRFNVMMNNPVSFSAMLYTGAVFGVIFLVAFITNLRQVHVTNPVNLLAGARQGEKEPKSSWVMAITGIISLLVGYGVALYFASPTEILLFFFAAVFFVILGTYLLFTSGSIALLKIMRRNKRYYYTPHHFILISGMIYRMKQNAAGLATICVLSCMVLVTVSSTVSLNVGAEDSLSTQYPYDYEITYAAPGQADALRKAMEDLAVETDITLPAVLDYSYKNMSATEDENGNFIASEEFSGLSGMNMFSFLSLADYNKNASAAEQLMGNEALILVTGGKYDNDELTVNGATYRVRPIDNFAKVEKGRPNLTRSFMMVLPEISGGDVKQVLAFDMAGTEEARAAFTEKFPGVLQTFTANESFQLDMAANRDSRRESWYATNGGFLFLGVYFGILFTLAAVLIIYYKQLSEGYDDAARFEILQKVGMSEAEVKQTISRQILTVFFLPLAVAVLHITVAFFPVSRVMVIFSVINIPLLALVTAVTMLAYAGVYLMVFKRTAKTYFSIVKR